MSSITTRPATDDDVSDLASRLRQPDLDALAAAFPTLPAADALKLSKDRGECHVACLDGRPVGLFGITTSPLRPARGFPWFTLAAEPKLSEATISDLVRLSARLVDEWQGRFPELVAMGDPRNGTYAEWLKFLGFVEMDTVPTASGRLFNLYFREAREARLPPLLLTQGTHNDEPQRQARKQTARASDRKHHQLSLGSPGPRQ